MLIIKHPGNRNTLYSLAATGFTRPNTAAQAGRTLGRISANAPAGALGGMAAMLVDSYTVNISTGDTPTSVVGFFLNDAAGQAFENTPAVASGKLTVMTAPGSYETDIYETVNENNTPLTIPWTIAAIGAPLYVSNFGLLTTQVTGSIIVGYVTKYPSTTNPFLGFNTVI
jgi:hypothetical protein